MTITIEIDENHAKALGTVLSVERVFKYARQHLDNCTCQDTEDLIVAEKQLEMIQEACRQVSNSCRNELGRIRLEAGHTL